MTMGKRCALFCLGGGAYVVLEFLWRGWSHISMFFAGGLCFVLIGHLGEVEFRLPLPLRVLVGVGIITMVDLLEELVGDIQDENDAAEGLQLQ